MQLKELGDLGENIACDYLQNHEYQIIERNFKCRQGEIDVIAADLQKKELVFIEIKTRTSLNYGLPSVAVTKKKREHIFKSIEYYIYKNHIRNIAIRLDVMEIYLYRSSNKVNHIKKAFI